jgi:hypothetical protein
MAERESDAVQTHDAGDLVAAYGAELGPDRPITVPDTDDGGAKSKTSTIDDANASPFDDKDMISVGTNPQDTTKMIKVAPADLYSDGKETVTGKNFVEAAIETIQGQVKQLDAFIDLDEANGDAKSLTANEGREGVWDAIDGIDDGGTTVDETGALQTIFGSQYEHDGSDPVNRDTTVRVLSDSDNTNSNEATHATEGLSQYPLNRAGDAPDDVTAKEKINDILAALGSLEAFEKATAEGGTLYGRETGSDDEDGLLDGKSAKDVFNRVPYTVEVRYGHTDYTRFGAWFRTTSTTGWDAPAFGTRSAENTGDFAYSPEAQTKATEFPANGRATYEGRTVARDTRIDTTDDPDVIQNVPKFYHGDIQLQVGWAAGTQADPVDNSNVTAIVSNLLDADGGMYTDPHNDAPSDNTVMMIIFDGVGAVDSHDHDNDADTPELLRIEGASNIRVRYEGFGLAERLQPDVTGALTGKFVGESIDGPRGVIGNWSLNDNFTGVFGVDLIP